MPPAVASPDCERMTTVPDRYMSTFTRSFSPFFSPSAAGLGASTLIGSFRLMSLFAPLTHMTTLSAASSTRRRPSAPPPYSMLMTSPPW